MKRAPQASGFTIVETMIVLAVTGVLFLGVATTINGRQNHYRYVTDSQDIRNRLQQMLNDVQNGYFPSTSNFKCSMGATALMFNTTAQAQGTNQDCIFLGKAMQFSVGTAGADPEKLAIATIAGHNTTGSVTDVLPTVAPSLTENLTLGVDLQTQSIKVNGAAGSYDGVAFLSDTGTIANGGDGSQLASGQQAVHAYAVRSVAASEAAGFGDAVGGTGVPLYGASASHGLVPATGSGIQVCFKSLGTANNYAIVTIGAGGLATDISLVTKQGSC